MIFIIILFDLSSSRSASDLGETDAGTQADFFICLLILDDFYAHAFSAANNCFNSGVNIVGVKIG